MISACAGCGKIMIDGLAVDLKPTDPGYAEAKRRGIKRPRVRLYDLPNEVPDYYFDHIQRPAEPSSFAA